MSHRNGIIYVDTSQNPPVGISIEDIRFNTMCMAEAIRRLAAK